MENAIFFVAYTLLGDKINMGGLAERCRKPTLEGKLTEALPIGSFHF